MPLDTSLKGAYEYLENGSLVLYHQNFYTHRFQCAVDYVVGVSRPERQIHARSGANAQQDGEAPQFTYTPRDRSYREGSSVKLNCEVIGRPRPRIQWTFQGGRGLRN